MQDSQNWNSQGDRPQGYDGPADGYDGPSSGYGGPSGGSDPTYTYDGPSRYDGPTSEFPTPPARSPESS